MKQKERITLKQMQYHITYGEPYKLDKYDKLILNALNEDARQSLADLSRRVGLSRDAIRKRIQKMVDAEVIHVFRPIINPPKLGFPIISYIFLALANPKPQEEEKFVRYIMTHSNIVYAASLIGKWDYVLYIMARNPGELNSIMKNLRNTFPEMIRDYEIHGVLDEFKYEESVTLL